MNTNQTSPNLDDQLSFAVSGQPQNNDLFKPVKQLANRLQSINTSIVRFNRSFVRAENSAEQRVDTKPSIDMVTTFRKSKASPRLTNEQKLAAKLYLDTYESEKAHGHVRNQEEWMRKNNIVVDRVTLYRWVRGFKDSQQ